MIGKFESNKDLVQELTASGAQRVGKIAALITGTVAEVAREVGEFITDAIEMKEAAAAARRDAEVAAQVAEADAEPDLPGEADLGEPTWLTEPPVTEAEIIEPKPAPEQQR